MSLKGASLVCLNENKSHNKKILKPKGKSFRVGENFSCDYIYEDKKCKRDTGVYFEILADAFGKVTIINHLKLNPINVNGIIVKSRRPLRDGSSIKVFDKEFIWKFPSLNNNHKINEKNIQTNLIKMDKLNDLITKQKSESYTDKLTNQTTQMKRCTVHSFFQWIKPTTSSSSSFELDTSSVDKERSIKLAEVTTDDNELKAEAIENQTIKKEMTDPIIINSNSSKNESSVTISNHGAKLLPSDNLINISDKENEIPDIKLSKCRVSEILFTTYTPNKFNEQSFNKSTPKSQYSTPKSYLIVQNLNTNNSKNLIDFSTPQANNRSTSMHFTDLITPIKSQTSVKKIPTTLLKSALKNSAKNTMKCKNISTKMNKSLNNSSIMNNKKLIKGREVFKELNITAKDKSEISNLEKLKSKSFIELNSSVEPISSVIDIDHTASINETDNIIEISSDTNSIENNSLAPKGNVSLQKSVKIIENDTVMKLNKSTSNLNTQRQQQSIVKKRSIYKSSDRVSFVKKISPEKVQLFLNDDTLNLSQTKKDLSSHNCCFASTVKSSVKLNSQSLISQPKRTVSVNCKGAVATITGHTVLRFSQSESKPVRQKTTLKRLKYVPNSAKASSSSSQSTSTINSLKRRLDYAAGLTKFTKSSIKKSSTENHRQNSRTGAKSISLIVENSKNYPSDKKHDKESLSRSTSVNNSTGGSSVVKSRLPIKAQVSTSKIETQMKIKTEIDDENVKKENLPEKVSGIVEDDNTAVQQTSSEIEEKNVKVQNQEEENTIENISGQQQHQQQSEKSKNEKITDDDKEQNEKSDDLLKDQNNMTKSDIEKSPQIMTLVEQEKIKDELNRTFEIENNQQHEEKREEDDKNEIQTENLNRTFEKITNRTFDADENEEGNLCEDYINRDMSKSEIFSEKLIMENSVSSTSPSILINNRENSVLDIESENEITDDVFKTPSAKMLMIPTPKSANVIQKVEEEDDDDYGDGDAKEEGNISKFYDINDYIEKLDDVFEDINSNNDTGIGVDNNDEKEIPMELITMENNASKKSVDPLNLDETFNKLVGNPIIKKQYSNSKKDKSKYSNNDDLQRVIDDENTTIQNENFPKTDIEEWIENIDNYLDLMNDEKMNTDAEEDEVEEQRKEENQMENKFVSSVSIEQQEGTSNMSGIDVLANDETNKSLFSEHLFYSDTSSIYDEGEDGGDQEGGGSKLEKSTRIGKIRKSGNMKSKKSRRTICNESENIKNEIDSGPVKECNDDSLFENFECIPSKLNEKNRGNSMVMTTSSARKKEIRKRRRTVYNKPLNSSFDIEKMKMEHEIKDAFKNFDENSRMNTLKKSISSDNLIEGQKQHQKLSGLEILSRTIYNKPLDSTFDWKKEKNLYEMNAAFANFSEYPEFLQYKEKSFTTTINGTTAKKMNLKKSRLTVGQKPLNKSFDLEKEKFQYELRDALQCMPPVRKMPILSKSVNQISSSSSDEELQEFIKVQHHNMSLQQCKSENVDIEEIRNELEKESAFKNFDKTSKISLNSKRGKSLLHSSTHFSSSKYLRGIKLARKTLGQKPIKSNFDIEIEKLRYEKEVEFKNFCLYPELSKLKAKSLSAENIAGTSKLSKGFHSFDHRAELEREIIFLNSIIEKKNDEKKNKTAQKPEDKNEVTASNRTKEIKTPKEEIKSEEKLLKQNEELITLNTGNTLINDHINEILKTKSQSTPIAGDAGQNQKPKDVFLTPIGTTKKRVPRSRKKEMTVNDLCNESSIVGFDSFLTPLRRSQRTKERKDRQDEHLMNQMNSTSIFMSTEMKILETTSAKKVMTTRSVRKTKIVNEAEQVVASVSNKKPRRGKKQQEEEEEEEEGNVKVKNEIEETTVIEIEPVSVSNKKPRRGRKLLEDKVVNEQEETTTISTTTVSSTTTRRGKKQEEVKAVDEANETTAVKMSAPVSTKKSRRGKKQEEEGEKKVKVGAEKEEKHEEDTKVENEMKETTAFVMDTLASNKKPVRGRKKQQENIKARSEIEDADTVKEIASVSNTKRSRGRKPKEVKIVSNGEEEKPVVEKRTSATNIKTQNEEHQEDVKVFETSPVKVEKEIPVFEQEDNKNGSADEIKKPRRGGRRKKEENNLENPDVELGKDDSKMMISKTTKEQKKSIEKETITVPENVKPEEIEKDCEDTTSKGRKKDKKSTEDKVDFKPIRTTRKKKVDEKEIDETKSSTDANGKSDKDHEKSASKLAEVEEKLTVKAGNIKPARATRKRKATEKVLENDETKSSIDVNGDDENDKKESPSKLTEAEEKLTAKTVDKKPVRATGKRAKGKATEKVLEDDETKSSIDVNGDDEDNRKESLSKITEVEEKLTAKPTRATRKGNVTEKILENDETKSPSNGVNGEDDEGNKKFPSKLTETEEEKSPADTEPIKPIRATRKRRVNEKVQKSFEKKLLTDDVSQKNDENHEKSPSKLTVTVVELPVNAVNNKPTGRTTRKKKINEIVEEENVQKKSITDDDEKVNEESEKSPSKLLETEEKLVVDTEPTRPTDRTTRKRKIIEKLEEHVEMKSSNDVNDEDHEKISPKLVKKEQTKPKQTKTARKRKINENAEKKSPTDISENNDEEDHEKSPSKLAGTSDNNSENINDIETSQRTDSKTVKKPNTRTRAGTKKKEKASDDDDADENTRKDDHTVVTDEKPNKILNTKSTRRRGQIKNGDDEKMTASEVQEKSTVDVAATVAVAVTNVNTDTSNEPEMKKTRTRRKK